MKPEKQRLIHDLLGDESRREAAWLAGSRVLRRRRRWRSARRGMILALMITGAALWFGRWNSHDPLPETRMAQTAAPASAPSSSLTDDQLLALFPDTPVALATLSDGRKRLIFPRPGDEQRFMTRL